MKHSENIICFSSIDWDFIWQGHQQIMQTFASQGHRVLFIENTGVRSPRIKDISRIKKRLSNWRKGTYGIRQINPNLFVYSPLLLPFPYSKIALHLNSFVYWHHLHRWLTTMDFQNPIVWSFLPTALTHKMISKINNKLTIYYCIDKFSESSQAAKKITRDERRLLKQSDLVFTTSHELLEYCSNHNKNVHFFPFGVDFDHFFNKFYSEKPPELNSISGPIIGYIGGIHQWIDFDLVSHLASKNPHLNFVFVGPVQTDISNIENIKNILFIPKKEKEVLPHYIYFFDICIIPYKLSPYTENVYPTKLNEYLAMGKKVISTPLKEIIYFNQRHDHPISVAHSAQEFNHKLSECLQEKNGHEHSRYIEIAKTNSWNARLSNMNQLISQKISKNEIDREKNWSYRLKKLHRNYSTKMGFSLMLFLVLCYSVFHTSLVWHLAQPLTIKNSLQKSDVILALGGGVGESGEAGQGYQERVTTAVELYQKGYANHIIFSSGYIYLLQEAQIMKKLAMSLGVPEKNISIETKANNTYENVQLSSKIIQEHHFKSILIISSPYHLKRAQLVAQKQLPKDIKFILYPVKTSLFFDSLKKAPTWTQLKTLIHEYAALIYYKFKKYI